MEYLNFETVGEKKEKMYYRDLFLVKEIIWDGGFFCPMQAWFSLGPVDRELAWKKFLFLFIKSLLALNTSDPIQPYWRCIISRRHLMAVGQVSPDRSGVDSDVLESP